MKTFKLMTSMLAIALFIGSHSVNAQGKGQEAKDKNKDKTEKIQEKTKEAHDKAHDKAEEAVQKGHEKANKTLDKAHEKVERTQEKIKKERAKENQGNAYGKNKGDLSGREFGQHRAAEARRKLEAFEQDIKQKEILIIDGRRKVAEARDRLQRAKEGNSISISEVRNREQKINDADEKLTALERVIHNSKLVAKEERLRLDAMVLPEKQ